MVGKYTIVVEGKDDERFLTAVLEARLGVKPTSKSIEFFKLLNNASELSNKETALRARKEAGNEILIILDGDCGGFLETSHIVQINTKSLNPHVFLFPNNKDDGRLETLLRRIVPLENQPYFTCIQSYKACIAPLPHSAVTKFDHHREIFVYVDSIIAAGKSKGHERDYSIAHVWDLNNEALDPLVYFLKQHIK
jgi:hypothetical protein